MFGENKLAEATSSNAKPGRVTTVEKKRNNTLRLSIPFAAVVLIFLGAIFALNEYRVENKSQPGFARKLSGSGEAPAEEAAPAPEEPAEEKAPAAKKEPAKKKGAEPKAEEEVKLQNAIEEATEDKPLTEEEDNAKLDKEINSLAKEGEKVGAQAKLKDAKKSLAKLETAAKVEKLQAELKAIDEKQGGDVQQLENVRNKIASIVDEKKEPEADPIKYPKPQADLTAFQANMVKINKEEEEKEAIIEARKATLVAFPKNPVVEAAEAAEEEHEAAMKAKFEAAMKAKFAAEKEAQDLAKKQAKQNARRDEEISGTAELWTANMPENVKIPTRSS